MDLPGIEPGCVGGFTFTQKNTGQKKNPLAAGTTSTGFTPLRRAKSVLHGTSAIAHPVSHFPG